MICLSVISLGLFAGGSFLSAQEGKPAGPPPAQVVVSSVTSGTVSPAAEFVGTVYFREVSDVAGEVDGKVNDVRFEEGKRVKGGEVLVRLETDLLRKEIEARKAAHEEVLADLENASIDLRRSEDLYSKELIAEQAYDQTRFRVKGLEKKAASLKADLERLEIELGKKDIKAPYNGVVIEKFVDRGEWLEAGGRVATMARDDVVDVIVNVPQEVMKSVTPGMEVEIIAGSGRMKGNIFSVIPRGDIQTRTYPVKIRAKNSLSLVEGMEARMILPTGEKKKSLIVPRDAVLRKFGDTVVYVVSDFTAKMFSVDVVGYSGLTAGVEGEGLKEGMKVVVKGNERLMDGQTVKILNVGK
jgi:RND family efflux transporter MFP subunit